MASNNNTQSSTRNLFLDNAVGDITAENLRTFVDNIFEDGEVNISKFTSLTNFESGDVSKVYEGSLVVCTEEDKGLYISLSNQPTSRTFLVQISNYELQPTDLEKSNFESIGVAGQYMFTVEYKDNLVDFFVDAEKLRASRLMLNSTPGINGTTIVLVDPLLGGEEVEIVSYK